MGFDIGNGLSAMGKSIADQAGAYGLAEQKAELQNQLEVLANQLAEGRETRLAGVKAGYDTQLEKQRNDAAMDRTKVTQEGEDRRQASGHLNTLSEISARTKGDVAVALARHKIDGNDVTDIQTDNATGKKYAVTKKGQMIDLGITGPNDADEKLMARAEKFGATKKTVVDPDTGQKTTEEEIDPQKAADFLKRQGRDDLAQGYATPKAPVIPPIPKSLPPGSQYSPSRKQWRDPKGNLYDASGAPVSGGKAAASTGIINSTIPGP